MKAKLKSFCHSALRTLALAAAFAFAAPDAAAATTYYWMPNMKSSPSYTGLWTGTSNWSTNSSAYKQAKTPAAPNLSDGDSAWFSFQKSGDSTTIACNLNNATVNLGTGHQAILATATTRPLVISNGVFKMNTTMSSSQIGHGSFNVRPHGKNVWFRDVTFSSKDNSSYYYCALQDNTTVSTCAFERVTGCAMFNLFYYNYNGNGKMTYRLEDSTTSFGGLYGYNYDGGTTKLTDNLIIDNSRISFAHYIYGSDKHAGSPSTGSNYDQLAITVKLGSNNNDSSAALAFRGEAKFNSNSTLTIDANGKDVGSYAILQAGAMTNPGNLAITLKDGSTTIGSSTTISAISAQAGKCKYMGTNGTKVYSLFSPDGKSVILSITPAQWTFTTITDGYRITGGNLAVGEKVDVYTAVGTTSWAVPEGVTNIEYLVIGGGGAGGCKSGNKYRYCGAGGGAGGYVHDYRTVVSGDAFSITVGKGGDANTTAQGGSGDPSSLKLGTSFEVTASGGGGGASHINTSTYDAGIAGASGGGAVQDGTAGGCIAGQGNVGGLGGKITKVTCKSTSGETYYTSGGGGGAGGAGQAGFRDESGSNPTGGGSFSGNGGVGLCFATTGVATYYAGGGGGGNSWTWTSGGGGAGGGGAGSSGTDSPTAGVAGLGGGGGGAGSGGTSTVDAQAGGNGGSGVVIIRYTVNAYYWKKSYANEYWDSTDKPWFDDEARSSQRTDYPNSEAADVYVGYSGSTEDQSIKVTNVFQLGTLTMKGGTVHLGVLGQGTPLLQFPSGNSDTTPIIVNEAGRLSIERQPLAGNGEIQCASGTTTDFGLVSIASGNNIAVSAAGGATVGVYAFSSSIYKQHNFTRLNTTSSGTVNLTVSNTVVNMSSTSMALGGTSALKINAVLDKFNVPNKADTILSAPNGTMTFANGSTLDIELKSTVCTNTYTLLKYGACTTAGNLTVGTLKLPNGNQVTIDKTMSALSTAAEGQNGAYYYKVLHADNALTVTLKLVIAQPTQSGTLVYDGTEQTVTLTGDAATYTVTGNKGTNADTYTAKVTPNDGYCWSDGTTAQKDVSWSIAKKGLTVTDLAATDRAYDGTTAVTLSGGALSGVVSGDDVTATMPTSGTMADANVGTGKAVKVDAIMLTGAKAGNYTLTQPTVTVNITQRSVTVPTAKTDLVYTGEAQTGVNDIPETTYATASGTASATVEGSYSVKYTLTSTTNCKWSDNTTAEKTVSWSIAAAPITAVTLTEPTSVTYDGQAHKPTVASVTANGKTFTDAATGWTVAYKRGTTTTTDFTSAGMITVTVTGKENLSGTGTATFTIGQKTLTSDMVTVSPTTVTFNGNTQKPTVTMSDVSPAKITTSDYTLTNNGGTNVGKYSVTVVGKGNYTGTVALTDCFEITPADITTCTVGTFELEYTGKDLTSSITFLKKVTGTFGGNLRTLAVNTDYTVTPQADGTVGFRDTSTLYHATITGKGNYTGTLSNVPYTILGLQFVWVGDANGNGNWWDSGCWDRTGSGLGHSWPSSSSDVVMTNGTYDIEICNVWKPFSTFQDDTGVNATFHYHGYADAPNAAVRKSYGETGPNFNYAKDGSPRYLGKYTTVTECGYNGYMLGCNDKPTYCPLVCNELHVYDKTNTVSTGLPASGAIGFGADDALMVFTNCIIRQDKDTVEKFVSFDNANNYRARLAISNSEFTVQFAAHNRLGTKADVTISKSSVKMGMEANSFGGTFTLDDSLAAFNNVRRTLTVDPEEDFYGDTVALTGLNISGENSKFVLTGKATMNGGLTFVMPAGGFANDIDNIENLKTNINFTAVEVTNINVAFSGVAPVAIMKDFDLSGVTAVTVDAALLPTPDVSTNYPLVRVGSGKTLTAPEVAATVSGLATGYTGVVEKVTADGVEGLDLVIKRDIAACAATVQSPEAIEYTGSELSISFDVKGTFGGTEVTLTAGTDYEVSFTNKIGREESSTTYVATITGKGNYEGTLEAEYTILGRVFVWAGGDSTDNRWNDATKWDRVGSGTNHGWPGDDNALKAWAPYDIPTFPAGAAYVDVDMTGYYANVVKVKEFVFDPAAVVTVEQKNVTGVNAASNSVLRGTLREIRSYNSGRSYPLFLGGTKEYRAYPVIENTLQMEALTGCPWDSAIWLGGTTGPTLSATGCTFPQGTYGKEFITFYCEDDTLPVKIAMTNTIWRTTCGSKDANMVGRNVTWTYCNSTNLTGIIANHFGGALKLDNSVVGFQNLHGTVAAANGHLPDGSTEEGDTFYATGIAFSGANTKFALSQNANVSNTVTFTMPTGGFANNAGILNYHEDGKVDFNIDTSFAGVAPFAVATNLNLSAATLTVDATAVATAVGRYPLVRVGEAGTLTAPTATPSVTGVTGAYVGLVEATADGKGLDLVIANSVEQPKADTPLYYTGDARTGVAADTGYTVTDGTKTDPGDYVATVSLAPNYRWVEEPTDTNDLELAWRILNAYKVTCGALDVVVNKDWTDAAFSEVEKKQLPVQTKLNEYNNTYKLIKYWEVYAVGFSASKASEVAPVVQPVQTTDAANLRLNLGADWPAKSAQPSDSGVKVEYELHNAQMVGAEFNAIQTNAESPQFDIPLSDWKSNVQYYRIRPVFENQ